MSDDYHDTLLTAILDEERFVEAVFQGARRGAAVAVPWARVTIRPVPVKGQRRLQITTFDGTQERSRNISPDEARAQLGELLALPFNSIQVRTTVETIRVQFSKKGRPILHRERRDGQPIPLDLAHDRAKPLILDETAPFLSAIGVMTADGRIRAGQQRKLRQINEFLRLIDETGEIDKIDAEPLRVVDLGCGSAALTFATYHYLTAVKKRKVIMTGVDTKAHLMERHATTAAQLGWDGLRFAAARILDYAGDAPADVVLALHACDTATDEALAQAIGWRSRLVLSAPCCHHHLQAQLSAAPAPEPFRPVTRHGILRERLGDALTDAFRAHILRLMGYRAEVLEFVPIEHTPKNLMIRAVYTGAPPTPALTAEYLALKAYWGVTPFLETLLGQGLQSIVAEEERGGTQR